VIELSTVSKVFHQGRPNEFRALREVSLTLERGGVTVFKGPSGSGKTTLLTLIGALARPTSGRITLDGRLLSNLPERFLTEVRRHTFGFVFQQFNLIRGLTVLENVMVPLKEHSKLDEHFITDLARLKIALVGLPPDAADKFPETLSGGMRKRAGLARALALDPEILFFDEPTSGLDVSVQATILNLFLDLQRAFGLTYLFISHDLSVVRLVCHRVAVMYLGRIVEIGDTEAIFETPRHPYTNGLLDSMLSGDKRGQRLETIPGAPPSLGQAPAGCSFAPRCRFAATSCTLALPEPTAFSPTHTARCFRMDTKAERFAMLADA